VILSPDGTRLGQPRGYNLSVEGFVEWLQEGLAAYAESKKPAALPLSSQFGELQ